MITSLANVTLLVKDYDEAIRWYTEKLGLELRMDGSMGGEYRFVTVGVNQRAARRVHRAPQALRRVPGGPQQRTRPPVSLRQLPGLRGTPEVLRGRVYSRTGRAALGCPGRLPRPLRKTPHVLLEPQSRGPWDKACRPEPRARLSRSAGPGLAAPAGPGPGPDPVAGCGRPSPAGALWDW